MNKITIRFDGGAKPSNPGNRYGSFEVSFNGRQIILVARMELGYGTNNEAEYLSLESALKWTTDTILEAGNHPKEFYLEAFTDSRVVISRMVKGKNSIKGEAQKRMQDCANQCLKYTILFHAFTINWNGRGENVARFGH